MGNEEPLATRTLREWVTRRWRGCQEIGRNPWTKSKEGGGERRKLCPAWQGKR